MTQQQKLSPAARSVLSKLALAGNWTDPSTIQVDPKSSHLKRLVALGLAIEHEGELKSVYRVTEAGREALR